MPSPDFWADIVTATLSAQDNKSMSKSKVNLLHRMPGTGEKAVLGLFPRLTHATFVRPQLCKRAVKEARSRLPDAKKSILKEELDRLFSIGG